MPGAPCFEVRDRMRVADARLELVERDCGGDAAKQDDSSFAG
jgi:hypothetical protein